MIRTMVVDDSPVGLEVMVRTLASDPLVGIVATASNGEEAVETAQRLRPDVVTMDIHMPRMNGFEATRRIMESCPTRIIVVSGSLDSKDVEITFQALEAGALAAVPRPYGIGHPEHEASVKELLRTVRLMSEVKVVRRWPRSRLEARVEATAAPVDCIGRAPEDEIQLIAMGASTGGPLVLKSIISSFPEDFGIPVLIVQHMAAGFVPGFAEWLRHTAALAVQLAVGNEPVLPGHVYLAPDGFQMKVHAGGRILLAREEQENGVRPSVSCLFRSVAELYGRHAAGVLLTGMGCDGAEELKLMKDKGAITIAQDEQSSVVYGMPGAAAALDAARYILAPDQIAVLLSGLDRKNRKTNLVKPW
jgi:two-component system, chemotaxis family, protein-glutamate methylesterase/glutaminase